MTHTDRHSHTDRQTNKQTDRQIDYIGLHTDIQIHVQAYTDTQECRQE